MTNPPLRKQTLSTWTTISAIREIILLGPVCGGEIGSKSTERHEITEMHGFFFSLPFPSLTSTALHLQITFVPLTLDMCSKVSPSVKAHGRSLRRPLFFFRFLPPAALPPSARSVPLNFQGTLSQPFQIGLGLNFPCFMSLCRRISALDTDTS